MNEITTVNGTAVQEGQFRDIHTITVEIKAIYQNALESELTYAVKLGRKLTEAKSLVEHGEWANWIKDNLPFSQDKAGMMMKIYENYGANQESLFGEINSETFRNLGVSQAFALLQVPEEERETFVKENRADELSVRELKKKIEEANAEREALKQRADALDQDNRMLRQSNVELNQKANSAKELEKKAETAKAEAEKAKADLLTAKEKQKAAEIHEKETAVKLSQAVTREQEARAALAEAKANPEISEEQRRTLEREISEKCRAEAEAGQAEKISGYEARVEELQKKLTLANPEVAVFKTLFGQMQKTMNEVMECLGKISEQDSETAAKLKKAMTVQLNSYAEKLK